MISKNRLDIRYDIGSEGNCSQHLCCRSYNTNTGLGTTSANASLPASRFGEFKCDSPPDLALSVFSEMPNFINLDDISFSIFTGDIVSHDDDDQLSLAYVAYEEEVTYQTFKANLGNIVSPTNDPLTKIISLFMPPLGTTTLGLKHSILPTISEIADKTRCHGTIDYSRVFGNPQDGLTARLPVSHPRTTALMLTRLLRA